MSARSRHPHPLAVGVGEVHQHLVGAERQPVGGLELGVERLGQRRVDAEHAAPGAELAVVELLRRGAGRGMLEGDWVGVAMMKTFLACATTVSATSASRARSLMVA